MLRQLVKVANRLDSLGLIKEADALDCEIIRLASGGDFGDSDFEIQRLEDSDFQKLISGDFNPDPPPEAEVFKVRTSPSVTSYWEPAASASPAPTPPELSQETPPEEVETSVTTEDSPEEVETSVTTEDSTKEELTKNRILEHKKRQEEIRLKQEQKLREQEAERERIKNIIADVKYEDKDSLEKAFAEFEAKSPLEKEETEKLLAAARGGSKKSVIKILSILKSKNSSSGEPQVKAPVIEKSRTKSDPDAWDLDSIKLDELARLLSDTEYSERERLLKEHLNEIILDAKRGNKRAIQEALAVFESEGFKIENMDSKQLKEAVQKGNREIINKVLNILKFEVVHKDIKTRSRLLRALENRRREESSFEPQLVKNKFYLAKRRAGSGTPWSYVAEYDDLASAEIAENNADAMEEEDEETESINEYAVYDGETAIKRFNNGTFSLTPSYLDKYYGMNAEEIRQSLEEERKLRNLYLEKEWRENITKLIESGKLKPWQAPKNVPDFKDVIPGSISEDFPEAKEVDTADFKQVPFVYQAPRGDNPKKDERNFGIIKDKSNKSKTKGIEFGSAEWMEKEKKRLEEEDISARIQAIVKKKEQAEAKKKLKERVEERKKRKAELKALNEAAQNGPAESSSNEATQNSPVESSP